MHIYDFLFIIQLIVVIGLVFSKLHNVMNRGETYDMKMAWLILILFLFAWVIGLVIFLLQPERLIYSVLFKIDTFLLSIMVMFTIIELLLNVGAVGEQGIKPYMSNQANKFPKINKTV